MSYFSVNASEVTSRRAVFQIAAEIIANDMKVEKTAGDRMGCCTAFSRIRGAVEYERGLSDDTRKQRLRAVDAASKLFRRLYRDDNAYAKYPNGYWMGSRDNYGMKRRITALLAAAEVV